MSDWTLLDSGETGWKQLPGGIERKLLWARVSSDDRDEVHSLVVPVIHTRDPHHKGRAPLVTLVNEAREALSIKLAEYDLDLL